MVSNNYVQNNNVIVYTMPKIFELYVNQLGKARGMENIVLQLLNKTALKMSL